MEQTRWLKAHCDSLANKNVVITGATGDLGLEICRGVLTLGGNLILLCRSEEKMRTLRDNLLREYPGASIRQLQADLSDLSSADRVCRTLETMEPDILLHNAGIYAVPRRTCDTGLDNIFQVNFAVPYYMTRQLLPVLSRRRGQVVVMGSVAHKNAPTDPEDLDFSSRTQYPLVYGNSKRYLMFAFHALREDWPQVRFSIAHPGITLTNISQHHAPWVWPLIKGPMKLLFPSRKKAVRSVLFAMTHPVPTLHWAGPRYFDIWGDPAVKALFTCPEQERRDIADRSERLYRRLAQAAGRL